MRAPNPIEPVLPRLATVGEVGPLTGLAGLSLNAQSAPLSDLIREPATLPIVLALRGTL